MVATSSLLVHQAEILYPDGTLQVGDVLVRAGRIEAVAPNDRAIVRSRSHDH